MSFDVKIISPNFAKYMCQKNNLHFLIFH